MSEKTRTVLLVAGMIIALDQITKVIVNQTMGRHESIPVIDSFFHLTHVRNTGAAFGLLAQTPAWFRRPFFLITTALAVIVLVLFLRRTPNPPPGFVTAIAAILGGAIGNLIDRLVHNGEVIDFLDLHWQGYHWPAFNVADSCITLGVIALWWSSTREPRAGT